MDWLFLLIGSVCFVEVFLRLNSIDRIRLLQLVLIKASKVIRSPRISDHWKEKALPRYSLLLFKQSLLIFATLVASFAAVPFLGFISKLRNGQFFDLTMSPSGIAASTCIAILYATIRSKGSNRAESYGAGSKLLHQISLGAPYIGDALFDLEKSLYASKSPDVRKDKHVFVCGLARAGTTVLMRRLYESGQFRSLTYRDMPFVMAPNLWGKLSVASRKKRELQERAHGDGLMVDYESPEALEEVFWRTKCGADYIRKDHLLSMSASAELIEDFRAYVSLILRESKNKRYLSKNNNNILRLRSIADAFPQAIILVPFRDPLQQAYSLMNQHQRFTQTHSKDRFAEKYMNWLVHHEFGADHRPFRFDGDQLQARDTGALDYWLHVWVDTYRYLVEHLPDNAQMVCYEQLCDDDKVWLKLSERVQIPSKKGSLTFSASFHHIDCSPPHSLVDRAGELYDYLVDKSTGQG